MKGTRKDEKAKALPNMWKRLAIDDLMKLQRLKDSITVIENNYSKGNIDSSTMKYLSKAIEANKILIRCIERALDTLTEEERIILDRFYINRQKYPAESVMKDIRIGRSRIHEKKAAALQKFTISMYGPVDIFNI